MTLKNKIYKLIRHEKNIFLVGKSDSGKTFFVKNELIPFLRSNKLKINYFPNCNKIKKIPKNGIAIIDEVETFKDAKFLKNTYPNETPYYSPKYIKKVNFWFKNLKKIKSISIYIITRNNNKEISNFKKNIKTTDWDRRKVEVVQFIRGK